jgi:orotate phosphoribosyltransferase
MSDTATHVARALLEIGAVGFTPDHPITFKSGILSPVYVDNRRLPYWPDAWAVVIDGFRALVDAQGIDFDVLAGIETAGIPHSAALSYAMHRPSVFVRKQPKDHGTRSRVEGGTVAGKRVLLVEDLVTTGGSSLSGVEALRAEGAIVTDCLSIVSYGFQEATQAFEAAGVRLHTLTSFPVIVAQALATGRFDETVTNVVNDWLANPAGWATGSNQ